ncbi:MAG TPA: hypothetical protein VK158_06050, partial [Acidobacteriota bacterium]|nr:hypothetical protein [Acidobacteriota bacterium]
MADCFEASTNSEFYQLTNSITSTTTCINITAYNVTINGNWFTVEYGNQASPSFFAGINISGYGSATIENITIVRGAAAANTVARVSLYANSTRNISISNIEMQDARNALVLYSVINASISNISIADVSAKAVWVEGQNISLRDFTIDSAFTSMHINNSIGINISDITITSSNDAGIQVQNTSAGNWHNVSLDGSSTYALWANNISNMLLQNISAQFQLYAAYINASTNVTFNSLYANFSDLYSVQVAYSNAVRFIQSQIQNTGTGYADLKISGASNFTVINDTTLYNLSLQSARFVLVNTTSGRIDTIGTVTADLVPFWDQIVFDDNLVQINESLINTSANITLTSVPIYENPAINKDGRECFDPYCVNLTALDQATVQFNISSMGDYSIEESASITSCGTLSRDNFGYRLESDLNATGICLILDADNITINGQGYTITGDTTSQALQAVSHTNITFANITLRNVSQAIDLDDITNSTFSNITILNATQSVYAI